MAVQKSSHIDVYNIWNLGSHAKDYEHRLMKDLFDGYNKDSRPVFDKSKAVDVELDVAYSQLVDLVSRLDIYTSLFGFSRIIWCY